ncbi:zinc-finger homeodomain protein 2-like [Wolffia australiana]
MDLPALEAERLIPAVYRECLRNHAAAMGGAVLDGCGEFMPSGEEGSPESFRCSACGCHRNFHRKEPHNRFVHRSGKSGVLIAASKRGYHSLVMPLGAAPPLTPESEEMGGGATAGPPAGGKKRFRTKFTAEQKEKMLGFAERVGWRLQKEDEEEVQRLCQEIGVRRRVFKVWMHNNKNGLARKSLPAA